MIALARVAAALRLYPLALPLYRLSVVGAETLVWRHGHEGVAIARAREAQSAGEPLEQWLYDWLVRVIAEKRHRLLRSVDVGTRYDVVAGWAQCPGQMIFPAARRV